MSAVFVVTAVLLGIGVFYYPEIRNIVNTDGLLTKGGISEQVSPQQWSSPIKEPPVATPKETPPSQPETFAAPVSTKPEEEEPHVVSQFSQLAVDIVVNFICVT